MLVEIVSLAGGLLFIADHAVQRLAQSGPSPFFRQDPRTQLPWWMVPDMLIVATLQPGDPVPFVVLMETCDATRHS
jgi:hypothetical protein